MSARTDAAAILILTRMLQQVMSVNAKTERLLHMAEQTEVQTLIAKVETLNGLVTQLASTLQSLKANDATAQANAQTITDNAAAANAESPKVDAAIAAAQAALAS